MVSTNKYKFKNKNQIKKLIQEMGYHPVLISNTPQYEYKQHSHPQQKLLVILNGNITIEIEGKSYNCKKGDEIIINPYDEHSAIVGNKGCEFYWAEKIIN